MGIFEVSEDTLYSLPMRFSKVLQEMKEELDSISNVWAGFQSCIYECTNGFLI